jgi:hypothetical protein
VQRFRNAALLGWLVLCATRLTTHFIVQAPPGNSLREVLPRYEAAKRWVSYYCIQGRLSRLPRVWMRSTAASSWPSLLLKCDHGKCAFDNTIVETLKQIVALPEALGKHS